MSVDPLAAEQLTALAAEYPPPEYFGPQGRYPYLPVMLEGTDAVLAPWLRARACPVIGLGEGPLAPACDVVLPDLAPLDGIAANICAAPLAAMVLVQQLRLSADLPVAAALDAESMAYATLQNGPEFRAWRENRSPETGSGPVGAEEPLRASREDGLLRLVMDCAERRNAIDVRMRDALSEAFDMVAIDNTITQVELHGAGRCFSVGGDVGEFGLASDPATAHWIRTVRLPARRLVAIADRLTVRIDGAAIGAGIEMAAFAQHVVATDNGWFQLPELKYGLIPGAGGTVSIPRRIGRQRTAYMALSMRRISAQQALAWGLVDKLESR